jgi:integrase
MGERPQRHGTDYPGVYYIIGRKLGTRKEENKTEKIFYCTWTENGKTRETKAGRQYSDQMTAAKANQKRIALQEGREIPKADQRKLKKWTIKKLWKEYLKSKGDSLKGVKTDKNRFEKHINVVFKNKTPAEIDPLSVERFRRKLQKNLSPQTVNNTLELLRRIVNFGVEKQLTTGLSFRIKLKKVYNERTEDLTPAQLKRLLKVLKQFEDRQAANFMLMALYTGMRRGELFKLKWDDIKFREGFIFIRDPKGGPDQRIPLNDMARRVLINHEKTESEYVFPGKNGRQRVDIKRPINKIREKAKLPSDFRPLHGLRHAYASMLASSGKVDMYTLQKLLTHKSPQMTQRYAHLRDEALQRAAAVADDLFKANGTSK